MESWARLDAIFDWQHEKKQFMERRKFDTDRFDRTKLLQKHCYWRCIFTDKTTPIPTSIVQIHKAKRMDSFATVLHSPSKFPQSLGDIGSRWLENKVWTTASTHVCVLNRFKFEMISRLKICCRIKPLAKVHTRCFPWCLPSISRVRKNVGDSNKLFASKKVVGGLEEVFD